MVFINNIIISFILEMLTVNQYIYDSRQHLQLTEHHFYICIVVMVETILMVFIIDLSYQIISWHLQCY
jgi:hypothetical protein